MHSAAWWHGRPSPGRPAVAGQHPLPAAAGSLDLVSRQLTAGSPNWKRELRPCGSQIWTKGRRSDPPSLAGHGFPLSRWNTSPAEEGSLRGGLLQNLNHKNIVKYLGSLKTKTHLHIILEFVENDSLADIINPNKFGPFPESLVAVYIPQVLEGLVYLHEQGVIHRDIKGANILTTKEGLVKLADFGVATKLNEADVNKHLFVGTPYWMAPEAIKQPGVCAASDIWSVGCTVIELLTCVPPYYGLHPLTALYKVVEDAHPPIPQGLSPDLTDFLHQCFKKDAMQRPDAKTLLQHPWVQNSRHALPSSLQQTVGSIRNIYEDVTMANDSSSEDNQTGSGSTSIEKTKIEESGKEPLATCSVERNRTNEDPSLRRNLAQNTYSNGKDNIADDVFCAEDPTLVFHEKPSLNSSATRQAAFDSSDELLRNVMITKAIQNILESRRENARDAEHEGEGGLSLHESSLFSFGPGIQKVSSQKVVEPTVCGSNELSQPLEGQVYAGAEASKSAAGQGNAVTYDGGKNNLVKELKARMAQKQMENETGQRNRGKLREFVMGLGKDVIHTNDLVFDENLRADNLFPLQSIEFSRLVGLLKPKATEDVILSACQKLMVFFTQHPEQKLVYMSQHGFLPLMELLEVPKNLVICAVLQIINHIVKDSVCFQENACLVGLIPVVMNFAMPDRPLDVRLQAAFFIQQLCQSSTLILQMFIACQGIPVLVGFLEADYAKYREMVHLAIDGMWQVFKLQHSTPRNDFCRIAAKNGILLRLVNTLHSLNEATRLALMSGGGVSLPMTGSTARSRSDSLDTALHMGQLDSSRIKLGHRLSAAALEPLHASASHSQRQEAIELDSDRFSGDADRPHSSNATVEPSASSKFPELSIENVGHLINRGLADANLKQHECLGLWKLDTSQADIDLQRQQRLSNYATGGSADKPFKYMEHTSNGHPGGASQSESQREQIRPLLRLLDKEPPSQNVSGQLDYVHLLSGLERHESILPLFHSSTERKTNGELDFLMAEFAEVSRHGRENGKLESHMKVLNKTSRKFVGSTASNEGTSTSGVASQTTSGVLTGSGVLNARPGSTTCSGLLSQTISSISADVAREYLEKVADLLLEFVRADTVVKSYMCSQSLLARLLHLFNRMEPPILLKILKCINHLSTDPNCLEDLQRADAIKYLIPNLELHEGPLIFQIHNEVLNALFNLCKVNKSRQEQAAENGIIPHLMNFSKSDSPLKQYALPLLCDMAHASCKSREQLRAHGGLDVYLNLLEDEVWAGTVLDSLAVCLVHDNDHRKVEQALLKKEAIQKLVNFFQNCPEQYFVHILEPYLKIIMKSSRINTAMAISGLTTLLIGRLDHQDAIARLNLLKLIKAVYEHHPKQLIVENDLPQKLRDLIEERSDGQRPGGQVLVKQMATALLKALHINTVL